MSENQASEKEKIKIIDLPTECLIEIIKHCGYIDIYNLKQSNSTFGDAIDYVVRMKEIVFYGNTVEDFNMPENFLKMFGSYITDVHFCSEDYDRPEYLNSIARTLIEKYCSNGNVKRLSLSDIILPKQYFLKNVKMFNSLDYLYVNRVVDDFSWFMDFVTANMIKEVLYFSDEEAMTTEVFKKISLTQLVKCGLFPVVAEIDDWIDDMQINLKLKSLDLYNNPVNPALFMSFPNLEVLHFKHIGHSLDPLLDLTKLHELHLKYDKLNFWQLSDFLEKLAKKNTLTIFSLYSEDDDNEYDLEEKITHGNALANILCNMTELRELSVWVTCDMTSHLPEIGKKLVNLRKLAFAPTDQISTAKEVTAQTMKFVKEARNLSSLCLECYVEINIAEFYADLAEIRKAQKNEWKLLVHVDFANDDGEEVEDKITAEQRKLVTMKSSFHTF